MKTKMKTIELTLKQAKELYKQGGELKEIALQAYSKEELEAKQLPRTWNEFCTFYSIGSKECYIGLDSKIKTIFNSEFDSVRLPTSDRNFIPSYEEAEAFLALMQLRQLRKAWIRDWKPDWEDLNKTKFGIFLYDIDFYIQEYNSYAYPMSFPTEEMAEDFLDCFKDLLEKTKPLYQ